ncbi:Yip1 family protein [Peptococcaceae bacterium 1198_IL3148]
MDNENQEKHLVEEVTEDQLKDEGVTPVPTQLESNLSVYDLVYGVLFDPANTFRRVAINPPVVLTVTLVLGMNLILALMGMITTDPFAGNVMGYANQQLLNAMQSMAPLMAMLGFIINVLVWLGYSSLLHLIAEFYGGGGKAITTFTAYGLAGLPALLLLPLQGLAIIFANSGFVKVLANIGTFGVTIWGIVLLVIALREVHQFTTGRAVLVVVTPWIIGVVLAVIIIIAMVGLMSSALPHLEQFGTI